MELIFVLERPTEKNQNELRLHGHFCKSKYENEFNLRLFQIFLFN